MGTYFVRATQPWNLEPSTQGLELCVRTTVLKQNKHTVNWSDKHVLLKWKDRQGTEQGNCTKTFVLCVLAQAGNLQFGFQHGPFTKRFKPVVTRVPAVVLSISRFSRLAVARAWLFALNKFSTEGDGDLQSLWPASSENVLVNLLLRRCGHCLWDWTFPHGSRKQTHVFAQWIGLEHRENYMRRCRGKCDIFFAIEHRLRKGEMEKQFNREQGRMDVCG